jgi:DNA-directed RNA polymerase subunit RPC12/RpoP
MSSEFNIKLKKLSFWLIFLSIVNIIIISLIPWISVVENDSKEELYFNSLMMERSNNDQIKNIANFISFIINLLLIVLIINTILYISFTNLLSEKYPNFTKIMKNISYINLIINVLITYLQINLIKKIIQMENLSLASIFSIMEFAYIPLIIGFLLLIFSIIYTLSVIKDFIKDKEFSKRSKKEIDEQFLINNTKKLVEKEPLSEKTIPDFKLDIKNIKNRDWIDAKENQKIDLEIKLETELLHTKNFINNKKSYENEYEEQIKSVKTESKINLQPFPVEKPKERFKESNKIPISKEFEKALSSVIEKRQNELKMQTPTQNASELKQDKFKNIENKKEIENLERSSNDEKNQLKKKINVRCPQCKFVFLFEKNEKTSTIKCPNCGKQGVIKYLDEIIKYPQQF